MYHFILSVLILALCRGIVNSMEENMSMQVSLWYFDLKVFACILKSGIAGPYGILFLVFGKPPHWSPRGLHKFHIPASSERRSLVPLILSLITFWSFPWSTLTGLRWDSTQVWFALPWLLRMLNIKYLLVIWMWELFGSLVYYWLDSLVSFDD